MLACYQQAGRGQKAGGKRAESRKSVDVSGKKSRWFTLTHFWACNPHLKLLFSYFIPGSARYLTERKSNLNKKFHNKLIRGRSCCTMSYQQQSRNPIFVKKNTELLLLLVLSGMFIYIQKLQNWSSLQSNPNNKSIITWS